MSRFSLIMSLAELEGATGDLLLAGDLTSVSRDSSGDPAAWVEQPSRRARGGIAPPRPDEMIQVMVSAAARAKLQQARYRRVRLLIDAGLEWARGNLVDGTLFHAVSNGKRTWATEIRVIGRVIDAISERQISAPSHPAFRTEWAQILQDAKQRSVGGRLAVALFGIAPSSLPGAGADIEEVTHSLRPMAGPDLSGVGFRLPLMDFRWPALGAAGAIACAMAIAASTVMELNAAKERYHEATRGIEEEYRQGASRLEDLESRRALLTRLGKAGDYADVANRTLQALAISEGPLLTRLDVVPADLPGAMSVALRFALVSSRELSPIEQLEQIQPRIASQLAIPVHLMTQRETVYRTAGVSVPFREYELSPRLPLTQDAAP